MAGIAVGLNNVKNWVGLGVPLSPHDVHLGPMPKSGWNRGFSQDVIINGRYTHRFGDEFIGHFMLPIFVNTYHEDKLTGGCVPNILVNGQPIATQYGVTSHGSVILIGSHSVHIGGDVV